jgi:3-oxoacyl-[acyl-carrier-protein] synthase-1
VLHKAQHLLATGQFVRCIVGGVDACTDGRYMAAAHHFNALKAGDQAAGFQPGEAAAFIMVESEPDARARGADILARIDAAAIGSETIGRTSGKPALGLGLADTIERCLGALQDGSKIGWIMADLNGDAFRGNDWGYALVRLMPRHRYLGECPLVIPAEAFGEIGAAGGPVAVCMGVRAFARGYAPAPSALAWLSSYAGSRGAFVISSGA